MTDPTAGQLPTEPAPAPNVTSVVAPSGGAGAGYEAEQEAGRQALQRNREQARRQRETQENDDQNFADAKSKARLKFDEEQMQRAKEIRDLAEQQRRPPGPGLPRASAGVIAATMDPNNSFLNPDVSDDARAASRFLPPGAHVPAPVLPQDSDETQYASKPLTEEHAEAGEKNLGAVQPPPDWADRVPPDFGSEDEGQPRQGSQIESDDQRRQREEQDRQQANPGFVPGQPTPPPYPPQDRR